VKGGTSRRTPDRRGGEEYVDGCAFTSVADVLLDEYDHRRNSGSI
jgi:hypothetical protein